MKDKLSLHLPIKFSHIQFGTDHKDLYVIDLVREEENRNSQTLELKINMTSMKDNKTRQYRSKEISFEPVSNPKFRDLSPKYIYASVEWWV